MPSNGTADSVEARQANSGHVRRYFGYSIISGVELDVFLDDPFGYLGFCHGNLMLQAIDYQIEWPTLSTGRIEILPRPHPLDDKVAGFCWSE